VNVFGHWRQIPPLNPVKLFLMSECDEPLRDDREKKDPPLKLEALRAALSHTFPSADIEEMLAEIERCYSEESL